MRQLRKLLGTSSSDGTSLLIPQVFAAKIIEVQASKLVLANLPGVWHDTTLVGNPSDTMTYTIGLRAGSANTAQASFVGPGGEIPQSEEGIDHQITLQAKKIGTRPNITKEAIEDQKYDMMARNVLRSTVAMARAVDEAVGRGMTQLSGAFPISGLNSNFLLERPGVASASGFSFPDDVLALMSAIESNYGKATDIIMHPKFYPGIRAAEWFRNAPAIPPVGGNVGQSDPAGFVGTAYGLRWWQSVNLAYSGTTLAGSGCVIMWDADQMPFVFMDKRPLSIENYDDPTRDLSSAIFTQRFNMLNVVPSAVAWTTGVYQTYYRDVTAGRAF